MAGITIRDIAIAFGYEVDKKSENKANESVQALKDTATKALAAIGIGFSLSQVFSAVKSIEAVQDALTDVKKDWAELGKELDETFGLTKMIVGGIKKVSAAGIDAVRRIGPRLSGIIKNLGGMRNVLKIVAVVGGAIFAAMNLSKITSGLKTVVGLLKSVKLSTLAIVAVFILLALLVEDFIKFMQGKNSLIGSILKQAGVDCDAIRDKVRATWENIKKIFQTVGGAIQNVVAALFGAIRQFWDENGEAIKKKVADAVVSMVDKLNSLSEWMVKNRDTIVKVAGKVLALVAAFLTFRSATTKVSGVLKTVSGVAGKLGKVLKDGGGIVKILGNSFKAVASPIGIAAAAIVAIAAIAFDFFRFMSGHDSVIGKILGKAGVDCDALRQKITDAWAKVKQFLLAAWNVIRSVCSSVWGGIQGFFDNHGDQIRSGLVTAWKVIQTVLLGVWNIIKTVATTVFGGLQKFWAKHGEQIKTSFVNIWTGIKNVVTTVWNILKAVATAVFNGLKAFWETWGVTIMTCFEGVWNTIKAVFSAVLDVLADLFAVFSSLFAGDWSGLWENVKQLASDILNGILNIISTILTAAWNVISSILTTIWGIFSGIFSSIWETVSSIVTSIKDTILGAFTTARDKVVEVVTAMKDTVGNVFQAMVNVVKAPINVIIDLINGMINGLNGMSFDIPDWIPGIGGKKFGFNIPNIPKLAQGGYLKANSPRLAVVGDNLTQGEIVAPEGKLMSIVTAALKGFANKLDPEGNGTAAQTIVKAIKSVVANMSTLAQAARPSVSTTSNATTNNSSVSKVVNFKSEINQQFNGDAAAQKNISKAADSAADDTIGALARALAYS